MPGWRRPPSPFSPRAPTRRSTSSPSRWRPSSARWRPTARSRSSTRSGSGWPHASRRESGHRRRRSRRAARCSAPSTASPASGRATTSRSTPCSTSVLARRRGLPILLSVIYVEVARRAGVPLRGVGLPGHFVVGHFGGGAVAPAGPLRGRRSGRGPGPGGADPALERARDRAAHAQQPRRLLPAARRTSTRRCAPRACGSSCPPGRPCGSRSRRSCRRCAPG